MAKYTVESANLSSIADAIREKGETTEQLEFPQGFIDAIGRISGEDDKTLLWKNLYPSTSFLGKEVSLSESSGNFERLLVVYRLGASTTTTYEVMSAVAPSPAIKFVASLVSAGSTTQYTRVMYVLSGVQDKAVFSECYLLGKTTVVNSGLIPYQIYGVKRLSDGGNDP